MVILLIVVEPIKAVGGCKSETTRIEYNEYYQAKSTPFDFKIFDCFFFTKWAFVLVNHFFCNFHKKILQILAISMLKGLPIKQYHLLGWFRFKL